MSPPLNLSPYDYYRPFITDSGLPQKESNPDPLRNITQSSMAATGLITSRYVNDLTSDPIPIGSCVLVGPQWILTAHHVLMSHEYAQNFQVVFGFFDNAEKYIDELFSKATRIQFSFDKNDYYSSEDGVKSQNGHNYMNGDWALIKLSHPVEEFAPLVCRRIHPDDAKENSRKFFIPWYLSKTWRPSHQNLTKTEELAISYGIAPLHTLISTVVEGESSDVHRLKSIPKKGEWKIQHLVNAYHGASGSPLMNLDGKFIGIHVRSPNENTPGLNPGLASNAEVIAQQLKKMGFNAAKEEVTLDPDRFQ